MVALAVLSLGAGVTLVSAFAPRAFLGLSTAELALILGLLALPLLTLVGLASDRAAMSGGGAGSEATVEDECRSGGHASAAAHGGLARVQTHAQSRRHPPSPRCVEHRAHEHA